MISFKGISRSYSNVKVLRGIASQVRTNVTTEEGESIEIPNRIPRSPTDILKALASTVGKDPTAAHYKYHDDPYLIPQSNSTKRIYAMSQESGRKAAQWIRQENAAFFQHKDAQPPIKALAPRVVYTEESDVNENCLQDLIKTSSVSDAIFVYKQMQAKGIPIDNDLKQALLELVCFYNSEDPLPEEHIEERWFQLSASGRETHRKTWKDGETAEQLFNEVEPKTPEAYAAVIRGMCKYLQVERAWALFQETVEKQMILDTQTFNSVLGIISFLKETGELRWELMQDLLTQMKNRNLLPNLGTLNACLHCISTISNNRLAKTAALKVLNEFRNLGIEPSLATWYYLLIIFCRERGPISHVLVDILNEIEGKEFTVSDPKDTYFFATAMDVCRNHLKDRNLAKRVDNLLHTGNNYDLVGDSYKESIYYRHFFGLLCQTEPLDEFMETYDKLVPNIYVPEPGIMEEILRAIDTSGALELVPRMWSDMIIFENSHRERLVNKMLRIISENKPNSEIPMQESLPGKFATIAWDIYKKIDEQSNDKRIQKLSFTGQMLGSILSVLCRAGEFEKAKEVFSRLDKNQHQIPGTPSTDDIFEFVDACINAKHPNQAIACVQYSTENGLEARNLARKINSGFKLNEIHLSKIKSLVGEDFLKN